MPAERILICGDRNWQDDWDEVQPIRTFVESLPEGTVVITGGARGADTTAHECAVERGLEIELYPADWRRYGRRAGPIRNQQMLDEGKPTRVVAFHDDIYRKGTADMVRRARKVEIPTEVRTHAD